MKNESLSVCNTTLSVLYYGQKGTFLWKNPADLRNDPVPYQEWFDRLRRGKFTHLVIDLSSHQDFLSNPRCELDWALQHPEHFQLLISDKDLFFFRINAGD